MKDQRAVLVGLTCLLLFAAVPAVAGGTLERAGVPELARGARAADVHSGWTLLWHDEFDVPGAPNPEIWSPEVNCWGGGNNERQCYTDRLENAYVDGDGFLHIVAKEELFTGPALQDDDPAYPGPSITRNYTSARLRTRDKADWRYGRVEVRAQLPGGQGMWPAIWMLPTDWEYGAWPSSGEIDVMEAVNLARGTYPGWGHVVHGTLHYGLPWPQWENHGRPNPMSVNPADGFHVYALEWEETEIRWYVDGVHWQTQTADGWYNYIWGGQEQGFVVAGDEAPFDRRFHLLMNVAVGGDWPGQPDRFWDADREMVVDYVRVYQCARGSVVGKGRACGTIDPSVVAYEDAGSPGIHETVIYDGGIETLSFEVNVQGTPTVVENTPVPGTFAFPGVTVDAEPRANGAWEIEFRQTGPLTWGEFRGDAFLGSADMSGVPGVETGFTLFGGTGWSNNGELEFDIKVKSIDPDTRLLVKMDSGYPEVGWVEIDIPKKGEWHHVVVRVADLLATRYPGEFPLDLTDIRNVFILESTGPARVWIDGIRLQCAFNTQPEWWQPDKTCDLRPRRSPGTAVDSPTTPGPATSLERSILGSGRQGLGASGRRSGG